MTYPQVPSPKSAGDDSSSPPQLYNVRDAALKGASSAFGKPQPLPKPLTPNYSGVNGALAAATSVAGSPKHRPSTASPPSHDGRPLERQGTGSSVKSATSVNNHPITGLSPPTAPNLRFPKPEGSRDRSQSPSNIAAALAAARYTPMSSKRDEEQRGRDILPEAGTVRARLNAFGGSVQASSAHGSGLRQVKTIGSTESATDNASLPNTDSLVKTFEEAGAPILAHLLPRTNSVPAVKKQPPPVKGPKPKLASDAVEPSSAAPIEKRLSQIYAKQMPAVRRKSSVVEAAPPGPELRHLTKARASGPKRKSKRSAPAPEPPQPRTPGRAVKLQKPSSSVKTAVSPPANPANPANLPLAKSAAAPSIKGSASALDKPAAPPPAKPSTSLSAKVALSPLNKAAAPLPVKVSSSPSNKPAAPSPNNKAGAPSSLNKAAVPTPISKAAAPSPSNKVAPPLLSKVTAPPPAKPSSSIAAKDFAPILAEIAPTSSVKPDAIPPPVKAAATPPTAKAAEPLPGKASSSLGKAAAPPPAKAAWPSESEPSIPTTSTIKMKPVLPAPRRSAKQPEISQPRNPSPGLQNPLSSSPVRMSPLNVPLQRPTPPEPRKSPLSSMSNAYQRESERRLEPHLTGDSLANAIVGAALASSRAASPTREVGPPPLPTRQSHQHHHHANILSLHRSRTPSPVKSNPRTTQLKSTMRIRSSSNSEDENIGRRHFVRKHPNKHREGSRKRWCDRVTERQRKRYEGVWAANKGICLPVRLKSSVSMVSNSQDDVSALVVRDIWNRSRLPQIVLEEVWDLVDSRGEGRLSREEFVVGLWLVDQRLKGRKLPQRVGDSVWDSVTGAGVKMRRLK